jgi:hypothetical protein
MKTARFFLFLFFFTGVSTALHGQIAVDLQIKRRTYVRYEPILATVVMTNLSGRDLMMRDGESPWFGFQITTASRDLVPPLNPNYHLDSFELKAGNTVKRTVNLNTLFSLAEYGIYRIQAQIYSDEMKKYFSSRVVNIEVTEGQLLWKQTVGVPEGMPNAGRTHTVSLLLWQGPERQQLYCRIEDREAGTVHCTHHLGNIVARVLPETQFDAGNNLYVLTFTGPKQYSLYKISVNGEFLGETRYAAPKSRPSLRRLADGTLQVVGGRRELAQTTPDAPPAKLSDRPPGLPAAN